ncbi:MAG: hypothetical protein ICV83_13775 [Cytophagales bacterium]|nr:hypothetical protein [Cytophagales bacterium]
MVCEVRIRQEQALQIALMDTLSQNGEWERKLLKVARLFQPHVPFDYLVMGLKSDTNMDAFRSMRFYRTGHDEYQVIGTGQLVQILSQRVNHPMCGEKNGSGKAEAARANYDSPEDYLFA